MMNQIDKRQLKRREYEREQEDLQLLAHEKEKTVKRVWLNFSILSLLVWIVYGAMVNSFETGYRDELSIITLLVQMFLFIKTLRLRNTLRK